MEVAIPERTAPKTRGILQDVRWFIRTKTREGWSLEKIQIALEQKYDRNFDRFMKSWVAHHSEGVVRYTERYYKRLEASPNKADADNNWRARW